MTYRILTWVAVGWMAVCVGPYVNGRSRALAIEKRQDRPTAVFTTGNPANRSPPARSFHERPDPPEDNQG